MLFKLLIIIIMISVIKCERALKSLHVPLDVTKECSRSSTLGYYLTLGGIASDTITLIFRTTTLYNSYDCMITFTTEDGVYVLVVAKFANTREQDCKGNKNVLVVQSGESSTLKQVRMCDGSPASSTNYFRDYLVGPEFQIMFYNNFTFNSMKEIDFYLITVTTARRIFTYGESAVEYALLPPPKKCQSENETYCQMDTSIFCMTKIFECDGIKNCGVDLWYDENKDLCYRSQMLLPWSAIMTMLLVTVFVLGALANVVARSLPKLANFFFIFNANEDNRLFVVSVSRPNQEASIRRKPTYRFSHDLIEEAMLVYETQSPSIDSSLRFSNQFVCSPIASNCPTNYESRTMQSVNVFTKSSEFLHQQLQDLALEKRCQGTSEAGISDARAENQTPDTSFN